MSILGVVSELFAERHLPELLNERGYVPWDSLSREQLQAYKDKYAEIFGIAPSEVAKLMERIRKFNPSRLSLNLGLFEPETIDVFNEDGIILTP